MRKLITLSLITNIVVLIPVCVGLLTRAEWTAAGYGDFTPARGILLSIYFSILLASVLLLVRRGPKAVAALILVQIIYKVTTPLTVGTLQNPIVISNLVIAAIHTVTLISIWKTVGDPFRSD